METRFDSPPAPALPGGLRPIAVGARLWRVLDGAGRALGHLEVRGDGPQRRYVARRFHAASGTLRALGAFWSADEAADCLRWSR
ncbi:hypothetical protein N3K63_08230 [Microbacterium sp. W1N]|uniref:hypothetical protein n=1 Tax=Microbacterium festucae TaxID=2977531 RepID=UPI0021BFA305|nr:hypothetical protein [Microbacterium festucae]MCT9820270.1 hypothetical protein [Microbacterium festucae]